MKSRFLLILFVACTVPLTAAEEPANLGPATNIQLLDEPGIPEKGKLHR